MHTVLCPPTSGIIPNTIAMQTRVYYMPSCVLSRSLQKTSCINLNLCAHWTRTKEQINKADLIDTRFLLNRSARRSIWMFSGGFQFVWSASAAKSTSSLYENHNLIECHLFATCITRFDCISNKTRHVSALKCQSNRTMTTGKFYHSKFKDLTVHRRTRGQRRLITKSEVRAAKCTT